MFGISTFRDHNFSSTVCAFRVQLRRIGMEARGWRVQSLALVLITLGAVKLCLY